MKIPSTITHSKISIIYALAYCFERASYYGMRVLIVLLMVDSTFAFTRAKALSIYGFFALFVVLGKVLGAIFGDLVLGNKKAILLGGVLQALGCFALCIETSIGLYLGMGLVIVGSGLFSSNTLAQFGKQYFNKPKLLDAGFTILFIAINIGSFVGATTTSRLGIIDYSYGFVASGLFVLIATVFVYFINDKPKVVNFNFEKIEVNKAFFYVLVVVVFSGIFWMIYENSSLSISLIQNAVFANTESIPKSVLIAGLSSFIGMFVIVVLAIIWTYIYSNSFFKLFIGFVISATSYLVLLTLPDNPNESNVLIFIFSVLLLSIGEMFISPMLFSITTRYSNPKYLAIILSLVVLPSLLFNKITGKISEYSVNIESNVLFSISSIVLFLIGLIVFIIWRFFKPKEQIYLPEETRAFLNEDQIKKG